MYLIVNKGLIWTPLSISGTLDGGKLGAIGGIDVHVVGSEIARPHAGTATTHAQLHADGNKIAQHASVHTSFAKSMLDAAATSENIGKIYADAARIDFHPRTSGCGENASPIRICPGEHGFNERRSGNRDGYLSRYIIAGGSANVYLDHACRAFAVCDDLQCQRATHVLERAHKTPIIRIGFRNCAIAAGAACESQKRIV